MIYFSYSPEGDGMRFYDTETEARNAAERDLELYRDDAAGEGWPECVTDICWGEVRGLVRETKRIERPPDDQLDEEGYDNDGNDWGDPDWEYIADYQLVEQQPEATAPGKGE